MRLGDCGDCMFRNSEVRREMSVMNLIGSAGVHFFDEVEDKAILGCLYPKGSMEYELEAKADQLLAKYASTSASIDRQGLMSEIESGEYDFGDEISVSAISASASREMTERFVAATSLEELASLVQEYDTPEAQRLSVELMLKRGWNSATHVAKFRSCLAV